jgi:4-amino-4-deoxy-L-arabinose transferase-like glycosyltransferase
VRAVFTDKATVTLPWPKRAPVAIHLTPTALLTWLAILAAGLYLSGFVIAGGLRLFYGYPLETQEDASLQVVRQILRGQPAYSAPSLDYIPVIYPPLYFYVSAGLALITGAGYLPLRLVSLVASLCSAYLIYRLVRRETSSRAMGLISAGLFVGTTSLSLRTLDIGRVDALGVALLLGSVYTLRSADFEPEHQVRLSAVAGLLAGLAVLTKQTNALVAVALLCYAGLSPRNRLLPFALAGVATVGVGLAAAYAQSGNWVTVYLFDLPGLHLVDPKHFGNFWTAELLPQFTIPLVFGPLLFIGLAVRRDPRSLVFYGVLTLSCIALAWGGWANRGSSENVLEPAFAALSVLFGLGIVEGQRLLSGRATGAQAARGYLLAVCLVEFLIVGYNPRTSVPLRSDSWAGARLATGIGALPGRVFAPGFGQWSIEAGKGDQPAYGSMMEIGGAFGRPDPRVAAWNGELQQALRAREYDYVLLDPTSDAFFLKGDVEQSGYVDSGPLFPPDDEFYLWKTGAAPDARVYVPVERTTR